jgi:hypothetical protein
MRRVLLLALLALPAMAQITQVGTTVTGQISGVNPAITSAMTTTSDTTLIVASLSETSAGDPCAGTLVDKVGGVATGNAWHCLTMQATSNITNAIAYTYGKGGGVALGYGANHTFEFTAIGGGYGSIAVAAWRLTPTNTVDPIDGAVVGANSVSSTVASLATGTYTPSQGCDLIISGAGVRSFTGPTSSPLTRLGYADWVTATYSGIAIAGAVQTAATAVNNTWSGGSGQYAANIAGFKYSGTCGSSTSTQRRRFYGQ